MTAPDRHAGCSHEPGNFLVTRDGTSGEWVAGCKTCTSTWASRQPGAPYHVLVAVAVSLGMNTMTVEEAERLAAETGGEIIRVGQRIYDKPMPETVEIVMTPDHPIQFTLLANDIDPKLLRDFNNGEMQFALTVGKHALMLGVKISGDWVDGSWQATKQRPFWEPGVSDPDGGYHLAVFLRLVNARTGILAAIRHTSIAPLMSQALYDAVQSQLGKNTTDAAGEREIARWMRDYPTPLHQALRCAQFRCVGGSDVTTEKT